jgi:hypothetical protein
MPSLTDERTAHAAPTTGTGPDEIRGRHSLNERVSGIDAILPNLSFTNLSPHPRPVGHRVRE